MSSNAEDAPACMHQAVLDAMLEPVLIYDDREVLYANDAAGRLLGCSEAGQLQGMRVSDFILPELAEVNNARRQYVLQQGIGLRGLVVKVRSLGGEPIVLSVDIEPISFDGTSAAMATLSRG